ncbi:uncharacterized protein [Euphorbia lathyris]|uniref:uncharacterized protein n=1 Tax=Euphorbia lathyris TaxID=212925 RepID=UPI003313CD81
MTFGLKTGGRIESILVSLPLTARWEYDHPKELKTSFVHLSMLSRWSIHLNLVIRKRGQFGWVFVLHLRRDFENLPSTARLKLAPRKLNSWLSHYSMRLHETLNDPI